MKTSKICYRRIIPGALMAASNPLPSQLLLIIMIYRRIFIVERVHTRCTVMYIVLPHNTIQTHSTRMNS